MATEDRHPSENNHAQAPAGDLPSAPPALPAKGLARRRFAKASAGATGVLLTLHSQPGMACTYCGVAPSAAISAVGQNKAIGTLSHHGPAPVCNGKNPGTWCSGSLSWPRGCASGDAFHKYFSCSQSSPYYAVSCQQILAGHSCDPTRMGQYMMAAYLNVVSSRVNFMTVESLESAWNEWISKNYYEPMPGQRWYANDIVGYLYGTMD